MTANLNEKELKALAYLHEHAKGYGSGFPMPPGPIAEAADLSPEEMSKAFSYLTEWHLIGSRTSGRQSDGVMEFRHVYLTNFGENLIRQLEAAPGLPRKLTVKVVSEVWAMGKGAIVAASAQLLGQLAPILHR